MAKLADYKGKRLSIVLDEDIYEILKIYAEKQNRPLSNLAKSVITDFCNNLPELNQQNQDKALKSTES